MSDKNLLDNNIHLRSRIIKPSSYTSSYLHRRKVKNQDKEITSEQTKMTTRTPSVPTPDSRRGNKTPRLPRGGRTNSATSRTSLGSENLNYQFDNNSKEPQQHVMISATNVSNLSANGAKNTGAKKKDIALNPQHQFKFPEPNNLTETELEANKVNETLDQSLSNSEIRRLTTNLQNNSFIPGSMEDLRGAHSVPYDTLSTIPTQQRNIAVDPNPGLLAELNKCKQLIRELLTQRDSVTKHQPTQVRNSRTNSPRYSDPDLRTRNMDPRTQRPNSRDVRFPEEDDSASGSEHSYTAIPSRSDSRTNSHRYYRPCEMEKWPIKFSSGDGLKFWEKVERCQRTYGYDDNTVYKYFYHLVQGQALNWYWQYVTEYKESNLAHLKIEFIRVFKSRLSDATIISDMYNKKQGRDTFERFYNDLIDMNFTLRKPLPDSQIIEILRNNMDDETRVRIFTYETQDRVNFFHKANQAYHDVCNLRDKRRKFSEYRSPQKINEIDFEEMSQNEIEEISEKLNNWKTRRTLTCYNCKSPDHLLAKCPEDITRFFCFKCGLDGYASPKCPNCLLKGQRSAQ